MSGWFAAVWPVITFVLGGLAAFGRDYFTESRQDRREREARQHERDTAARERREEFELEHLVEVHRLLTEHTDAVLVIARTTPKTEEAREAHRQAADKSRAVMAQLGFILDNEVREKATAAHKAIVSAQRADSETLMTLDKHARDARNALTARVREIYAGRAERGL